MAGEYRFSFGPWNLHEGADPFGPTVRRGVSLAEKFRLFKPLGFDGVQFHDDDVVPGMSELSAVEIRRRAAEVKRALDSEGLAAEFVAPRLWEDPRTVDGAYTSNDPACRAWAIERSLHGPLPALLMVTAYGREGLADYANDTAIREVMVKPVSPSTLLEAILRVYHRGDDNPPRSEEAHV